MESGQQSGSEQTDMSPGGLQFFLPPLLSFFRPCPCPPKCDLNMTKRRRKFNLIPFYMNVFKGYYTLRVQEKKDSVHFKSLT